LNDQGLVRESRTVEHDASAVLRIDYEDDAWQPGSGSVDCHLRVLKNRHGRTGSLALTFERKHQRFVERIYES
jgi:replicative DNA helicase